jgi:hypothetical protein
MWFWRTVLLRIVPSLFGAAALPVSFVQVSRVIVDAICCYRIAATTSFKTCVSRLWYGLTVIRFATTTLVPDGGR